MQEPNSVAIAWLVTAIVLAALSGIGLTKSLRTVLAYRSWPPAAHKEDLYVLSWAHAAKQAQRIIIALAAIMMGDGYIYSNVHWTEITILLEVILISVTLNEITDQVSRRIILRRAIIATAGDPSVQ